jgi:hypothetical protein
MIHQTDTTNEKAPGACDSKGLTNDTKSAHFPTTDAEGKAFKTLAAGFAQAGHTPHRTCPKDGTVTYWTARGELVRILPTIDAAGRFLVQVGGRP